MKTEDINKLMICREAVEKHNAFKAERRKALPDKAFESERSKSTLHMLDVLKQQGFNTFDDFQKFNYKMNFDAYKECRPIQGICDLCGLKELKDQPCFKKYGNAIMSCAAAQKEGESYMDGIYKEVMRVEREGSKINYNGKVLPKSYCPEGHGYHVVLDRCSEFPFDVFWGK